jgi:8-oxo-dGTP pyrophosphatase MutT (NUDIX family)
MKYNKQLKAGVIVFKWQNNNLSCLLVESKWGKYSFPKGSREKGETPYRNALRELNEETGICESDIDLVKDFTICEYYRKKLSCIYYVAFLKKGKETLPLQIQEDELISGDYYDINRIFKMEKLNARRKDVLDKTLKSERVIVHLMRLKK